MKQNKSIYDYMATRYYRLDEEIRRLEKRLLRLRRGVDKLLAAELRFEELKLVAQNRKTVEFVRHRFEHGLEELAAFAEVESVR